MAKRRKPVLRFFHKKPMENPNESLDLNELADIPPEEQVEVVTPMEQPAVPEEPQAVENAVEPVVQSEEVVAPQCGNCAGSGLIDQNTICAVCSGTGRVA